MSRRSKARAGETRSSKTRPKQSEPGDTASKAPAGADDDTDVEAIRYELARKLMLIVSDWRHCPKRACKRRRGCAADDLDCHAPERGPELTPDQEAAMMADLRRAIERRMAETGRGR